MHYTNGISDSFSVQVMSYDLNSNLVKIGSSVANTNFDCATDIEPNVSYINLKVDPANGILSDCFRRNATEKTSGWVDMPANFYRGMGISFFCFADGTITSPQCVYGGNGITTWHLYVFTAPEANSSGGILGSIFGYVRGGLSAMWDALASGITLFVTTIKNLFQATANALGAGVVWGSFWSVLTGLFGNLGTFTSTFIATASGWVANLTNWLSQTFIVVGTLVLQGAAGVFQILQILVFFLNGAISFAAALFAYGYQQNIWFLLALIDFMWGMDVSAQHGFTGFNAWALWNFDVISFPFRLSWWGIWLGMQIALWVKQMVFDWL
jgi:hypothetical protein